MTSERVTLARARCLIDVTSHDDEPGQVRFVARMWVVDPDGAIVHPLVGPDGRRIKIHATSARLATRVAVSYLEGRFGRKQPDDTPAGAPAPLATATIGMPFIVG